MAKLCGGWVLVADVSDDKVAAAKSCGADALIDVRRRELATQMRALHRRPGVDAAIDFVASRETLEGCMASLARAGRLVIIGGRPPAVFGVDARFTVEPGRMLNDMGGDRGPIRSPHSISALKTPSAGAL